MKRIILLLSLCFSVSIFSFAQNKTVNQDTSRFVNFSSKICWIKNLDDSLSTSLISSDDKIFAAAKDGKIFCYNFDGKLLWQHETKRTIISRPIDGNGNLITAALSGDLISLNDSTGEVVQSIGLDEPLTSQLIKISTDYNGQQTDAVVVGTAKGSIYCYDINSFEMIWENHSAKGIIESQPLALDNKIVFTSGDGFLYCIDSRSGMLIWKWSDPKSINLSLAGCSPVSDGKSIFVCSSDKYLASIDLMLGKTNWENNFYDCYSSLALSGNKEFLLIKSSKDNFYIVSAKKGRTIRKINIDFGEDSTLTSPLVWNGKILFGTQNGKVYLIEKDYKWKPLFFMGSSPVQNIIRLTGNTFAVVSNEGKIVVFNPE
ncbi:MAG: outer membrane protein assembly factor BamB family protein [Ignavibacteriaceae bacterium]